MKRIFILCVSIVCCIAGFAQIFTQGDLTYNVINRTEKNVSVKATDTFISGDIVIPEQVTDNNVTYTVTSLGESSFSSCRELKSITIPESVKKIEDRTFSGCTSLKSINIGNGVTDIGDYAFFQCTSLESIELPDNLSELGGYAFSKCTSLESIELPDRLSILGFYAFDECTSLESVIIPGSVITIGDHVFDGCSNLYDCYFKPKKAPALGSNVFKGTLEDINIHIQPGATGYTRENGYPGIIVEDLITSVPKITNDMDIYSSNGKICVKSEIATKINIYSISGLVYPVNLHPGLNEFTLPKGIYIVKREKLILQ